MVRSQFASASGRDDWTMKFESWSSYTRIRLLIGKRRVTKKDEKKNRRMRESFIGRVRCPAFVVGHRDNVIEMSRGRGSRNVSRINHRRRSTIDSSKWIIR